MKYLIMILFATFFFCGCNGTEADIDFVNETTLPGTYILKYVMESTLPVDFTDGFITFNSDKSFDGTILFKKSSDDCIFDGRWSIDGDVLIIDIYNTTNSLVFDFGRTLTCARFIDTRLEICFQNDEAIYAISYE